MSPSAQTPFDHKQKLHSITSQCLAYIKVHKVLQDVETLEHDPVTKVELLTEAGVIENKLSLGNLDYLLLQAKQQPYFNRHILRKWANTLEGVIRHRMAKFKYAKLFRNLFDNWLTSGDADVICSVAELEELEEKDFGGKMQELKTHLTATVFEEW
ncbi:hypothetical protein M422DRAFT_256104 [Sphaerobolus stellatus SS14]|uniref:Uncharacterized protein n=1 Tax=Sphaerobolus stellatus (strain SS14) TaxID=990650 RepID=A0A0C9VRK7_SPHS4|nr:hypothetical protein M422DRAFT_256104 [Sphaerobolus stellatus SS14]